VKFGDMRGLLVVAGALLAGMVMAPGVASASMTVQSLTVTPTTTAAGAHPDVTVDEKFQYSDNSDSVLNSTLHFPPGLLGNPQASALCSESDFEADTCPANTQVGSAEVTAAINGALPTTSDGSIYNLVPDGSHPAVLGIVVRPSGGASKIFLKSPVSLRTSSDFGIDSPVNDQPNTVTLIVPVSLQITETSITLFGTRPWLTAPFMTNPTSCKPATTSLDASSHEAPGTTETASTTFTPTACDQEAFSPQITATMGAPGATAKNSHVPFAATITQPVGESAQLSTSVTLPPALAPGVGAVTTLCTPDQLTAAACPDASRIGTATIASPLLATPVQGPVFEILHTGQLPGVGVEFGGVLPFVLGGNAGLTSGRLQNVFTGLPDVPLTSFELAIDGGPHGLLQSNRDICTGPAPTVDGAFAAQSGALVTRTAAVTLVGCPAAKPHAKVSARGFRGAHPRLQLTLLAGASKLRSATVTLPKSIVVGKGTGGLTATGASFRLSKKSLKLSRKGKLTLKLPSRGASRVTVTLSGGRIHGSKSLKKELKRHKSASLKLTIRTVDVKGHRVTLRPKFAAKR
jgi:hypothetical protein